MQENLALPREVIIARLNQALRGWANYFYYGNCSKTFVHLRNYTEERVRVYLSRKHTVSGAGDTRNIPMPISIKTSVSTK